MTYPDQLIGTLRLNWEHAGSVGIDADGKIRFPKLSTSPGLYRFLLCKSDGGEAVYVGETDNLQRRFAHYRNPGPTQPTNLRLNALFKEVLSKGGRIDVFVSIRQAWINWQNTETPVDFSVKNIRRLFENFALSVEGAGEIEALNK